MGQIVGGAAKPKRCNLNQLSQLRTPAAGEYILVSSDNSMNAAGQGNFDCYIVGNGTTAAAALLVQKLDSTKKLEYSPVVNLYDYTKANWGYINSGGTISGSGNKSYFYSDYIIVKPSTTYSITRDKNAIGSSAMRFASYDAGKNLIIGSLVTATNKQYTTPANACYIRISGWGTYRTIAQVEEGSTPTSFVPFSAVDYPILSTKIVDYMKEVTPTLNFVGWGSTMVGKTIILGVGKKYRFSWGSWALDDTITDASNILAIGYNDGSDHDVIVYGKTATLPEYYDLTAVQAYYYYVRIRATLEALLPIYITEIPSTNSSEQASDAGLPIKFFVNLFDDKTFEEGYINSSGGISANSNFFHSDFIPVKGGVTYSISKNKSAIGSSSTFVCSYDNEKELISDSLQATDTIQYTTPNDAKYIRISGNISYIHIVQVEEGNTATEWHPYTPINYPVLPTNILEYMNDITPTLHFVGSASTLANKYIILVAGKTYRFSWNVSDWTFSGSTTAASKLVFGKYVNGVETTIMTWARDATLPSYVDISAESADYYYIGIRAPQGMEVQMYVTDISMVETDSSDIILLNGGENKLKTMFASMRKPKGYNATTFGNKIWTIAYMSDLHDGISTLERFLYFCDTFSDYIDDMLHGGDAVADKFEDENPFAVVSGGSAVLNVIGNHDARLAPSVADVYNKFIAPYISTWGVVSGGTNTCYWYKDYTDSQLRLIALDCMYWDTTQKNWFIATLASAKTNGYSVVVVDHYCPSTWNGMRGVTFESLYDSTMNAYLNAEASAAVEDFIQGGGIFVTWLFGHEHKDHFGYLENYPNQFAIAVDKPVPGASWERDGIRPSTTGRERDAFDIISVDTTLGILTIKRIGCNYDKFLRQKNYLAFDYVNKKIVGNS